MVRRMSRILCSYSRVERYRIRVGGRGSQLSRDVFGTKDGYFCKQEFTLDSRCLGVIQDGPDGYEVFELTTSLFNDPILTS